MSNNVLNIERERHSNRWLSEMTKSGSDQLTILSDNDLQGIHDLVEDAELVEGPDELYEIVAELWPELLHKVKPPRALMH
jgi:hypothetical protein